MFKEGYIINCYTPFKFYKLSSYVNLGIRKVSKSKFDHSLMLAKWGKIWCVVEAVGKGIVVRSLPVYLEYAKKKERTHFKVEGINEINYKLINRLLGRKYDFSIFWRLFAFLISKRLLGQNSKITKLFSNEANGIIYFCYELTSESAFNPNSPTSIEQWKFIKNKTTYDYDFHLMVGKEFEENFEHKPINLNHFRGKSE